MEIGAKIKSIRMSKGLSIRSFARIVNLSYGYISKLEKSVKDGDGDGAYINPSIDVLKQICDRAHFDLALFLEETGYIKPARERTYSYDDMELLEVINSLPPAEKTTLSNMVKGLKKVWTDNAMKA